MNNEKGNTLIIFSILCAILLIILLFTMAIFMSHVNSVLYGLKLDMYSIARSGIISVNKNKANTGNFSYDTKAFKKEFEQQLKETYELDDNFTNNEKLISKITIKEYKIYNKGNKDSYTKERCTDRVLHIVLEVKIRPIILREFLERLFIFQIHEDVDLNLVNI